MSVLQLEAIVGLEEALEDLKQQILILWHRKFIFRKINEKGSVVLKQASQQMKGFL